MNIARYNNFQLFLDRTNLFFKKNIISNQNVFAVRGQKFLNQNKITKHLQFPVRLNIVVTHAMYTLNKLLQATLFTMKIRLETFCNEIQHLLGIQL